MVDYVDVGYWVVSVIKEVKKYCVLQIIDVKIIVDGKCVVKLMCEWQFFDNVVYLYYCLNEIIDGIVIDEMFDFGLEVVVMVDFFFIILFVLLDVFCYGVIYVGVQKNIGLVGLMLVIVWEDLLGKVYESCLFIFDYIVLNDNDLMFNMLLIFVWYFFGLVFKWLKVQGGVVVMYKINQ